MSKILVGGISEEGNRLLNMYIDKFLPNTTIEPLRPAGIKGRIKNHAKRPEVILVIIEDALYQMCVGVADEVLALPKVHRYVDDEGLKQFLISKFGKLDDSEDMGIQNKAVETSSPLPISDTVIDTPQVTSHVVSDDFDSSFTVHDDETEKTLRAELSTKDMIIENLTRQIEEMSSDSDDEDYVILRKRIFELESELESKKKEIEDSANKSYTDLGKVARAEQILNDVEELKRNLNKAKEDISALTHDKEQLALKLEEAQKIADASKSDVDRLKSVEEDFLSISKKNEELSEKYQDCIKNLESIERAKSDLDAKVLELNQTIAKLQLDLADKGVLEVRVTELTEKNNKAKETIAELESKVSNYKELSIRESNLSVDLNTVKEEKKVLEDKIESVKGELQAKEEEYAQLLEKFNSSSDSVKSKEDLISSLNSQISSLKEEITTKESDIESLQSKVFGLEKDLNNKNTLIASASKTIESLRQNVTETSQGVSESEQKIVDLQNSLSDSNNKVSDLTFELENAKKELISVKDKKRAIEDELNNLKDSISTSSSELDSLSDSVSQKDDEIVRLTSELDSCKKQLEESENTLSAKDSEILSLSGKIRKLESEIGILKTSSQETNDEELKEFIKRNEELESQITDLKRSIAKLESEKSSLSDKLREASDTSEKDAEVANLRIEVTRLQNDLKVKAEQVKSGVDPKRVKELEIELEASREKSAKLECDLMEMDDQMKEINENIFVRLSDYSLPKITFPLSVAMPLEPYERMYTFASGSAESCVSTYQLIKKIVSENPETKYLVVDLVTDTYIDRELGVRGITSPAMWLQGSDAVDKYLASTKFDNVKVISTALAYFNDLFLLNVDWKKRLSEIENLADVIILNVGSLDNCIHNILYNSFSSITKSNIIIKATPINLRTAYLHLSGIAPLKNTQIYCVNIEEQSKQLYQKLASKFPTQILRDTDILNL